MLVHCSIVNISNLSRCGVLFAPFAITGLLQDWELEMLNGSLVHLLLPLAEALLFV